MNDFREIGRFRFTPFTLLAQMNIWTDGVAVIAPLSVFKTVRERCAADSYSPRQLKVHLQAGSDPAERLLASLPKQYAWVLLYAGVHKSIDSHRLFFRQEIQKCDSDRG